MNIEILTYAHTHTQIQSFAVLVMWLWANNSARMIDTCMYVLFVVGFFFVTSTVAILTEIESRFYVETIRKKQRLASEMMVFFLLLLLLLRQMLMLLTCFVCGFFFCCDYFIRGELQHM